MAENFEVDLDQSQLDELVRHLQEEEQSAKETTLESVESLWRSPQRNRHNRCNTVSSMN